jgi:hypothetical protein
MAESVMRCGGECRKAGELRVRVRARVGCDWKEDRALGGTMYVGTLGNISDMRGNEGETGESMALAGMSSSEIMLARRPRPLGGRISGDGGVGDWLGDRGHGTLERCEIALLEVGRPLRKCNLEARLVMRRRRDIVMEDCEVEEMVDGECMRLGVSLTSKFRECLNLRIKEGMAVGGGGGSCRGGKREDWLKARPSRWSVKEYFEAAYN